MGRLHYKGYTGSVEYDEEDNYFFGSVQGLKRDAIIYEGDSAASLKKDFEESVEDYLKMCEESHTEPEKPYSGKLMLRISPSMHGMAAEKAAEQGISLNEFISRAVTAAL